MAKLNTVQGGTQHADTHTDTQHKHTQHSTLSKYGLITTLSIIETEHNDTQHSKQNCNNPHYTTQHECYKNV